MKKQQIAFLNQLRFAFERAPAFLKEAFVVLLVVFTTWADTAAPNYISLSGFYLLPIFLAVWYCSRSTIATVITISSLFTQRYSRSPLSHMTKTHNVAFVA